MMKTKVVGGKGGADGCKVEIEAAAGGDKKTLDCDIVLVSTGRRPFTAGLQLEKAGLSADKFGRIDTNEHWQTAVNHIYGIGDVIKGPMLAHKAEEEGIAAVEYILG